MEIVAFQQEFRPALPNVYGTVDYREFRDTLVKIDEILTKTDLEHDLVSQALSQFVESRSLDQASFFQSKTSGLHYKKLKHALRCNIARHLTGESYRLFSIRLADSALFQWFTGIDAFSSRKAISKSSLERFEKYFDAEIVGEQIKISFAKFSDAERANEIGLKEPVDFSEVLMDSTCIKAHIHFPVDWVLLRDAARSLLFAIKTIRTQGLKHRMVEPSVLLKEMNKLCISMTHTRRKKDSKKHRKSVLRIMKKLVIRIEKHAERYRQLLNDSWRETAWSEAQTQQVIRRIDNILEQLPVAIKQAHDRIIGERVIQSRDKILSLYDHEAEVIVRGKSGSEVEFGQRFLLAEQENGLIVDWKLFSKDSQQDSKILVPSVTRIEKYFGAINSCSTDRGFSSPENEKFLAEKNIYNAICPKSPATLKERLTDPIFISHQARRSNTEARIGIFKNVFLGKPLRSRIFSNKCHAINWCVLSHNLWVLSRKAMFDEHSLENLKLAA